jgi:hypothetical protein
MKQFGEHQCYLTDQLKNRNALRRHASKLLHGGSGGRISASGERFVRTIATLAMLGATSLTARLAHGLTTGVKTVSRASDEKQRLCFAIALWNGKDPILKERLFGLTNAEGNHGEDVKEFYFYLDSAPTHSYMKWLYKPARPSAYPVDSARPNMLRLRSFAPRICWYSVGFRPVPRPRRV